MRIIKIFLGVIFWPYGIYLIIRYFMVRRLFKTAVNAAKDDPKLQSAFSDLAYHHKQLQKNLEPIAKRNPDHPVSKKYFREK